MNSLPVTGRSGHFRGMCCLMIGAVLLVPVSVRAQDHDLVLVSVAVSPTPVVRGCPAEVAATIRIAGVQDDELASGEAMIEFKWRNAGSSGDGQDIGTVPVTWSPGDTFAITRIWPTHFNPVDGASVSWPVPSSGTEFEIDAEVSYTDTTVVDDHPGDNLITLTVPSTDGDCGGGCRCIVSGGKFPFVFCPDCSFDLDRFRWNLRIDPDELLCLLDPDCPRIIPDLCRTVPCPPCMSGLNCPPDRYRLLIEDPPEVFEVQLIDPRERVVARSQALKRPIEAEGRTYRQVLEFVPEKGVEYRVGLKGTKRAVKPRQFMMRLEGPGKPQSQTNQ